MTQMLKCSVDLGRTAESGKVRTRYFDPPVLRFLYQDTGYSSFNDLMKSMKQNIVINWDAGFLALMLCSRLFTRSTDAGAHLLTC